MRLRNIRGLASPVQEFLHTEAASGVLLAFATVAALIAANTAAAPLYQQLLSTRVVAGVAAIVVDKPLLLWINDGLMAIFFLVVGLEIKREMKYGQLSDFRSALLPAVAAAGGVVVPALIYLGFTAGTPMQNGWAIPMATDIAFAVGLLALVGSNVPAWVKLFLLTLAVVDDLIAVVVIALFFTESLKMSALLAAAIAVVLLVIFNIIDVRRLWPYLTVGVILWVAVLKSGVHATIAGVALGFIVPAIRPQHELSRDEVEALEHAREAAEAQQTPDGSELHQQKLEQAEDALIEAESPLHRLEHKLHPLVAWFVIPVFAFANAGVSIDAAALGAAMRSPMSIGIIAGLFIGKQSGIFLSAYVLMKLRLTALTPDRATLGWLYGTSLLAGIGFTMSLFIGGLAFGEGALFEQAKVAILVGSLISGAIGFVILRMMNAREAATVSRA